MPVIGSPDDDDVVFAGREHVAEIRERLRYPWLILRDRLESVLERLLVRIAKGNEFNFGVARHVLEVHATEPTAANDTDARAEFRISGEEARRSGSDSGASNRERRNESATIHGDLLGSNRAESEDARGCERSGSEQVRLTTIAFR
jgi:hypothetical protein